MHKMINLFKQIFYRLKLSIWATINLPKYLTVGDTNFKIPAHNWMVAIPVRIDTSEIRYFGRHRNFARYFYEPLEYHYFIKILKGKKIFFDVGANIGYYSYIAAHAGLEKIVAFEFIKEYADFTSSNFKRENISGVVVNKGVGNPKDVGIYSDPLANVKGELISLDEYAKANNIWPDVVKMDIEGFEMDALKNSHEILLKGPALDISIHDKFLEDRGQSEREVLELLRSYGYKTIWKGGGTFLMVVHDIL